MKDLISHLFPPKALQRQKRYLRRGLHRTCDTKIRDFIYCIDEMVECLKKFPPFREVKRLPDDEILELVEFSLPEEWQKELIIQGFDSTNQGLTKLIDFLERIVTKKEQSGERHQSAKSDHSKGSNQAGNPSEEEANKKRKRKRKTHLCAHCIALVTT